MKKIVLLPDQVTIEVAGKDSLLRELKAAGVAIKSSCGGHASCADCVVKIVRGEENLTPPPFEELRLLGNVFHLTRERLCCQAKALGEVVIDISGHEGYKKNSFLQQKEEEIKPMAPKVTVRKSPKRTELPTMPTFEKRNRPQKKGGNWRPKSFKSQ
ncbi:MAG: 2Fe-2S iron-sulfur cluster-binding protein [Bacteriovoracaceae bacterium]|nr:2Fe-2S iron-sulfur cluster-binding protein [Bacteriovoracaceae bacterium]